MAGTGKSTTRGQHRFSQVPVTNIPRSQFNRSQGYKSAFDAGYLIPFFLDEALPGDTFNLRATVFARLATPITPFMDNMWLDVFFFFVPNRLVWDNWKYFMGEQVNPDDTTTYQVPQTVSEAGGYAEGSVHDYYGIPPGHNLTTHSALPFRGMNLIWNEWFRDENLQNSLIVPTGDGPDAPTAYFLQRRGKRHDYFTSCLPWPQKGPSVILGLGDTAPVVFPDNGNIVGNAAGRPIFSAGTQLVQQRLMMDSSSPNGPTATHWEFPATPNESGEAQWDDPNLVIENYQNVYTDLSAATASTVNAFREAFQVQKLLERDARGGTRYTEIIRSHFGVVSPDARLQRPEYLGGGTIRLNVNPVAQTQRTDSGETPLANLAAYALATRSGIGFTKSFSEHGYVHGFISARADLNYQQGLERHWSRLTRYDYYWPAFSHLGEQEVLNKEIYMQGSLVAEDDEVFGYQERWAEYRYKPSLITGIMRSTAAQSLDVWHLAQEFQNLPVLGDTFIRENPPVDRVIAVQNEPHFILDAYFDYKCARPMPVYSVPGLIDHF